MILESDESRKWSWVVVVPQNKSARKTELGSGPSSVVVTDRSGNKFIQGPIHTRWSDAGWDVEFQEFVVLGEINESTGGFMMDFSGSGTVSGPFVFAID